MISSISVNAGLITGRMRAIEVEKTVEELMMYHEHVKEKLESTCDHVKTEINKISKDKKIMVEDFLVKKIAWDRCIKDMRQVILVCQKFFLL